MELSEQKLIRAIYSDRQLQEVLTDFWFNHFNVDARKGRDRFMLTDASATRSNARPRTVLRSPQSDGGSPAMLFYLDNWQSADPTARTSIPASPHAVRRWEEQPGRARTGRLLPDARR